MAMYTFGKAPTTRTGSRWGSCTGSNHHLVGDGDLFNHQVGKIGKNSHRLKSAQERGSLEILFGSLVYHTCHQRACGRTISWQGSRNQNRCLLRKYNETTHCHDLLHKSESLPRYPTNPFLSV